MFVLIFVSFFPAQKRRPFPFERDPISIGLSFTSQRIPLNSINPRWAISAGDDFVLSV